MIHMTLAVIHDQQKVLLGMKKRGFGTGKWNGFGGKVLAGETVEQAMHRELKEECGITTEKLDDAGQIEFTFADGTHLLVHLFRINSFVGEPMESEEMKPQWFAHNEIPFDQMWADDEHWMPHVLAGKNIKAYFEFDSEDSNTFDKHTIEVIPN